MSLADKVKNLGSGLGHNFRQGVAKYIVIPVLIAGIGAGVVGCGTPKDYVSTTQMEEYNQQSMRLTQEYVDARIAENNTAEEKVRGLEETVRDLKATIEVGERIKRSNEVITNYVAGEIKRITEELWGLKLDVNTATGATTRNEEQIANYAKQIVEITGQLKALKESVKTVSGDTATNKADYIGQIEALGDRVNSLEQRLSYFLPPVHPGFPPYTPPTPFSPRSVEELVDASRYSFPIEVVKRMQQWSLDDNGGYGKFESAFPFVRLYWSDGDRDNGEFENQTALHVDEKAKKSRAYLTDRGGKYIYTSNILVSAVENLLVNYFGKNPWELSRVTIHTR